MKTSRLAFLVIVLFSGAVHASDEAFFAQRVEPLLKRRCLECHSHTSGKIKGGLALDSKSGWVKGGDSGPAIVVKEPEKSLLVKAIRRDGLEMPPDSKLPPDEVATLVEWIQRGAFDPRAAATTVQEVAWSQTLAERRDWWCWQPIERPKVPAELGGAWSNHTIDRFLLDKMRIAGLQPTSPADRLTLLRRAALVLTGLPPSREEVDAALSARANGTAWSYEALVDRLLASPRFGEHWARHWLDLVRYSDSHGSEHDPLIPHAWRYRDYVVRAFNDDVPYDRFVQEHVAGDSLPPRWNAVLGINESLLGTTFWRFVEFYPTPVDAKSEEMDVVDSQIDALTKTFQALTVSCARCHDHKFDAISAHDYYALYGIAASTRTTMHRLDEPARLHGRNAELAALKPAIRRPLAEFWSAEVGKQIPTRLAAVAELLRTNAVPKKLDEAKTPAERLAFAIQKADKPEHLLFPFQRAARAKDIAAEWPGVREAVRTQNRATFVEEHRPAGVHDFSQWFASDGTLGTDSRGGDFTVATSGSRIVGAIYPSGRYSHLLSDKHGGTLRSPNFTLDMKFVSVLACGTNKARLRLVVENFQGNELLFARVNPMLNHDDLQWVMLPIKPQWMGRRAYLEIVPRDDMTYVGRVLDAASLPTDGRSGVGIRRVLFHDQPNPPVARSPLPERFWNDAASWDELAERLATVARETIAAWPTDRFTDDDAVFLDSLLQAGLLPNELPADHEVTRLVQDYRRIEATIPVPRRVPGVADEVGFDERFFPRGNYKQAGELVSRRYLEVLAGSRYETPRSGRAELARELTSPRNPLTARVFVNRLWHHVFGAGLVRSTDNFGKLGETPSHPELLDWLASELIAQGWSTKQMLRLMLTSQAFQLSAAASADARRVDPENRLLSHASVRRLGAEAIRDSLLEVSGRATRSIGGLQTPLPYPAAYKDFDANVSGPIDGTGRRSLYLEARRNYPAALLQAFDQPRPLFTVGRRSVTNVPAQSLTLLNDPFVHQQAELLGQRAVGSASTNEQRIAWLYLETLRRPATEEEVTRGLDFLRAQPTENKSRGAEVSAWIDLAHALLNAKEFIYYK